ncbi:MAG: hypothetical protein QXG86_03555 [Candidatus Woesearchaeota archaeon]
MKEVYNFLKEWAINFVKNKDIFIKTIIDIQERGREITIRHKHKEQKLFIDPFLEHIDNDLKIINEDTDASIICLNKEENLKTLIDKWAKLVIYKHLSIVFVNPFSEGQKYWAIFPYTHNKIADEQSLIQGLKTMFEQVELIKDISVENTI